MTPYISLKKMYFYNIPRCCFRNKYNKPIICCVNINQQLLTRFVFRFGTADSEQVGTVQYRYQYELAKEKIKNGLV